MHARSTVLTAECVNGAVMASSESLVTWALSAAAEFERRGRALAFVSASASLAGVCGWVACADAVVGEARVAWNCSRRVSVVDMMTENCWAILRGVGGLANVPWVAVRGCGFDGKRNFGRGFKFERLSAGARRGYYEWAT